MISIFNYVWFTDYLQNNKSLFIARKRSLTCVRSKFGHFEAHSSWRLVGAMRSSRSSGRSATVVTASVNTFRKAHIPVPNIIIPSPPPAGPCARSASAQSSADRCSTIDDHRSSLDLSRCFGCANRTDAPSCLLGNLAKHVTTPVVVTDRRRCSQSRVPSNRINKCRGIRG